MTEWKRCSCRQTLDRLARGADGDKVERAALEEDDVGAPRADVPQLVAHVLYEGNERLKHAHLRR